MKKVFVVFSGVLSALYLVYPSLGIFELIPDAIPLVGHVDEVTATMVLLWALKYFGIDPTTWFQKDDKRKALDK